MPTFSGVQLNRPGLCEGRVVIAASLATCDSRNGASLHKPSAAKAAVSAITLHSQPKDVTRTSRLEVSGVLIGIAIMLSSVFMPMAFSGGSFGVIHREFLVTIVPAMIRSIIVSLILTSTLCATRLRRPKNHTSQRGPFGWFTLSIASGRDDANAFIDRGRIKNVYLQPDTEFRIQPEDLSKWQACKDPGAIMLVLPFSASSLFCCSPQSVAFSKESPSAAPFPTMRSRRRLRASDHAEG